jgi:hypothetical protein
MPFRDHLSLPWTRWSDDVRVTFHPGIAYSELAKEPGRGGLFKRPIAFAVLVGLVIAISTSGRPTLRLVLSSAIAWSFVPVLHVVSVALVMFTFGRHRLPIPRAVDLYFMGLLPWSVWLLGVALVASSIQPEHQAQVWAMALFSAPAPLVWANVVTLAFFRRALGLSGRRSAAALVFNVAIVWGSVLAFFLLSGQLWPRFVGHG